MVGSSAPVRHVVLVIFDTLRRDALGCYGAPPAWADERVSGAGSLGVPIATPHLDAFARESVRFERAYPEALPTLCARRTIYTGRRTYPFHNGDFRHIKGDFVGIAPGWGPIPEAQATLAEMYEASGFRTGLISDLYHQFKPSKNFWRGFHQWTFIRGQEADAARSGPFPSQQEIDYWVPRELQELRGKATGLEQPGYGAHWFSSRILLNMDGRVAQVGRPQDIFAKPASAVVAGFIGSPPMNLLPAEVRAGALRVGGADLRLDRPLGADGPVTLGVRPAALRIAPTGIPARVYLIEDLGDTTIVDLDVGGQIVKLRTDQRPGVREGDSVHVAFAACHLFERDGGARRDG